MSKLSDAEVVARIAELGSRIYGLLVDKSRAKADREARIKELEKEVAGLKAARKESP